MDDLKIEIFDCNNWVRRVYEKNTTGLPLRNLFDTAWNNRNPVLYVFDGKGGKKKRQELYPEYKNNRPPMADAFHETLELFKMLVQRTNKTFIEVPGYEADDVIAHLIDQQLPHQPPILVHSNDADFLAKLKEGRVSMTDPSSKFKDIPYSEVRLYKTLCGDTSDNISGIVGFADGSYRKLTDEQKSNWRILFAVDADETMLLDETMAGDLGLSKAQANWVKANFGLLKVFWQIVGFIPMTDELIAKHTIPGVPRLAEANAILRTVFQ